MRTTITLDPDTAALVQRQMKRRGESFRTVVNDAIRAGLSGKPAPRFRTKSARMGTPTVSLDRALQVAAELEDHELVRKTRLGK